MALLDLIHSLNKVHHNISSKLCQFNARYKNTLKCFNELKVAFIIETLLVYGSNE
jgi:hypothetical protein